VQRFVYLSISFNQEGEMDRRDFMGGALALASSSLSGNAWSADKWGADQGYPTGWGGQYSRLPEYRVGNYSGGFEKMFPHHIIEKSTTPTAFDVNLDLKLVALKPLPFSQ
jgi:hypothetical protein